MIDELLVELFGHAVFGRMGASRRAQLLARMFFGFLGAGLSGAGAWYIATRSDYAAAPAAFREWTIAVFAFLGCFWLFNVALGRTWRWPGVMFVLSVVGLFVSRLTW